MNSQIKSILNIVILFLEIGLLCLAILSTNVQAYENFVTIQENEYHIEKFDFYYGSYAKISYSMEILVGPYIDVYFVDSNNFQKYKSKTNFEYIEEMTEENTRGIKHSSMIHESGTYYLIFDNTEVGTDPTINMIDDVANLIYNITYESDTFLFVMITLIIIVVICFSLIFLLTKKKKAKTKQPFLSIEQLHQPQTKQSYQQQFQIRYCPSCKKQIPIDSKLCSYCGKQLN